MNETYHKIILGERTKVNQNVIKLINPIPVAAVNMKMGINKS